MGSTSHNTILFRLLPCIFCIGLVQGHGRLIEPPSRSSMWRFGYDTPINYNDNQLFCGGFGVQYSAPVNGRCGVCGDPWNGPRENEVGGKYATGKVVRTYTVGHVIEVTVDLTANHKGYFEFRLCQKDDPHEKATWECMNKHLLVDEKTGLTRYKVEYEFYATKLNIRLRLPVGVKCKACVLQWKYNAGNSWGTFKNGTSCVGCGNQEQFYGCADIAIGYNIPEEQPKGDACEYSQLKNQWQWDCTRNKKLMGANPNPNKASREVPLLFAYVLSFLLAMTHSVL